MEIQEPSISSLVTWVFFFFLIYQLQIVFEKYYILSYKFRQFWSLYTIPALNRLRPNYNNKYKNSSMKVQIGAKSLKKEFHLLIKKKFNSKINLQMKYKQKTKKLLCNGIWPLADVCNWLSGLSIICSLMSGLSWVKQKPADDEGHLMCYLVSYH